MNGQKVINDVGAKLVKLDVRGLTDAERSCVAFRGAVDSSPVVLVHGMYGSVRSWLDERDADDLDLPDRRIGWSRLTPKVRRRTSFGSVPQQSHEQGLLRTLAAKNRSCLAVSFEAGDETLGTDDMIESIHRAVEFAQEYFQADGVRVVGHGSGGVAAALATLVRSPVMSPEQFTGIVEQVVFLGSPLRGNRLASATGPIESAFAKIEDAVNLMAMILPRCRDNSSTPFEAVERLISAYARYSPQSVEMRLLREAKLPELKFGYRAVAGNRPCFLDVELPGVGRVVVPPEAPIPELTKECGDMVTGVQSALSIPDRWFDNTLIVPVNHLMLPFDHRVQSAIVEWLSSRVDEGVRSCP
jgi:pimeloyl-ACP methyl ester carboxylesterase